VSWLPVRSFGRFLGWCISHQQDPTIFLYCSASVLISHQYKNKKEWSGTCRSQLFLSQ
jgi:hypothetical protein